MSPRFTLVQIQFRRGWKNISEHECGDPVTCRCCCVVTKSLSLPEPFSCPWILLLHILISSQRAFSCLWSRQHSPALAGAIYFFYISSVPRSADLTRSNFCASQTGFDPVLLSLCLSLLCLLPFLPVCPSFLQLSLPLSPPPPPSHLISCLSANTACLSVAAAFT